MGDEGKGCCDVLVLSLRWEEGKGVVGGGLFIFYFYWFIFYWFWGWLWVEGEGGERGEGGRDILRSWVAKGKEVLWLWIYLIGVLFFGLLLFEDENGLGYIS